MLQRFIQFETKESDWTQLKDLPFWKNLKEEDHKTLAENGLDNGSIMVKKVSKKFAKDFLNFENPKPFKIFYVIENVLIGVNDSKNFQYGYMHDVSSEIQGRTVRDYVYDKKNYFMSGPTYYKNAINISTDVYMSYTEEDAPKNVYQVKNVNVDKTLKSIWDNSFKDMLDSFAINVINILNEEGIEVIRHNVVYESEYGPYIAFYLENNDNFFIYHKSYHINFIGKNKPSKSGKTDKLDLKNLALLLRK